MSSDDWDEAFQRANRLEGEEMERFFQLAFQFLKGRAFSWVCAGLDWAEARGFIDEAIVVSLREYEPKGGLRTFLANTFTNRVNDKWYRPRKDAMGRRHAHLHTPLEDPDLGPVPIEAGLQSNPEAMLRLSLLESVIEDFAQGLPEADRLVLRMTIDGYTCSEIQARLPGRSAKDIRYRLRRDLKAFLEGKAKPADCRRLQAA